MLAPDTSIKLDVLRNGEAKTLTLTLGEMPNEQQAKADTEQRQSTPACRISASRSRPRVTVAGVRRQGRRGGRASIPTASAAEHGFKTGDVILDVGGKAVGNVGDVRKALTRRANARQARRPDAGEDRQRRAVRRGAAAPRVTECQSVVP